MEWHGIQIPHVISTILNEIGQRFNFATDTSSYEEGDLYFYDMNPTGRGFYFADNPDQKEDFLRYAVELYYLKMYIYIGYNIRLKRTARRIY
jgi:hypothetical protein